MIYLYSIIEGLFFTDFFSHSQIFFWYDGNKLNSLFNPLIHTNSYGSQKVQQVDLMGDTICIKVSNSGNPYALSYDSASFSVDYHIW